MVEVHGVGRRVMCVASREWLEEPHLDVDLCAYERVSKSILCHMQSSEILPRYNRRIGGQSLSCECCCCMSRSCAGAGLVEVLGRTTYSRK